MSAVEATGRGQTPWLDDNGDAMYDAKDGELARGRGLAAYFGGGVPVIDWVRVSEPDERGHASIEARVRDDVAVVDVTAAIYAPSYVEPLPGGNMPEMNVPTMTLGLSGGDVYRGVSGIFREEGAYRVVVYARDNQDNHALPCWASVGVSEVYLPLVMSQ